MPAAVVFICLLLAVGNIRLSSSSGQAAGNPCSLVASTVGNNANPGTLTQPVRTVQKLVDMLGPGQTGCLRGTSARTPFQENVVIANKNSSGSSEDNRITITAYPGEIPKLRGTVTVAESANFITVSKLVLETRSAVGPSPKIDGDDVTFSDNNVSGSGNTTCFRLGATASSPAYRTSLIRNRIHDCTDGISGVSTSNLFVDHNLIYDNTGWGANLQPNVKATGVTHNIFDGNGGGLLLGGDASTASTGAIVDYDIFSNSSSSSWNVSTNWDPTNIPPRYSSFVTNVCAYDPNHPDTGGLDDVIGGFMPVSPVVNQDPLYRDRPTKDFHLDSSSPCAGVTDDIAQAVDDGGGPTDEQASADQPLPNVLFIITDDQRADGTITQSQSPQVIMPQLVNMLEKTGTTYSNAFVPTPLCCPSRASIMTGRYAHNTIVSNNFGAWNFNQDPTLQAFLHDESGYRTGIFGKYLNDWNLHDNPAHWDTWGIFDGGYCPFRVNEDGQIKDFGVFNQPTIAQCGAYSTSYVRDKGLQFIDQAETDDSQPWFLYLAPFAPHGPATPDDQYANTDVGPLARRAVHDEGQPWNTADPLTDKPDWVQGAFNPGDTQEETFRTNELRSLKSVDDMVATVLNRLQKDGEQDTLVVYMGDNGFLWGEHGLVNKSLPYTDAIHVPLIVRYPPVTTPDSTDSRFVENLDLTPTALKLAGLTTVRSPPLDGLSLFDPANVRSRLLFEYENHGTYPTTDGFRSWASTRTATYQYIESYAEDGTTVTFREYYDLINDPDQQFNCYGPDGQPAGGDDLCTPAQSVTDLSEQLRRDRLCTGTSQCPPGPGAPASATDQKAPDAQVTQPTGTSYVCCSVKLVARALDNFGVVGVQFNVDGSPVGPEITQDPYTTVWDTTGVPAGQHVITATARDGAGNLGTSPGVIVNLGGMDVQAVNGPGTPRKADSGDTITYSFGRPVNPSTVQFGWSGATPSSCAAPAPPGCVTVGLIADNRYDLDGTDSMVLYKDPQRTATDSLNQKLTSMGSLNLGLDNYVGATTSFLRSPMELVNGGTAVKVTLGEGTTNVSAYNNVGTINWSATSEVRDLSNAPFCVACHVFESIVPWVDPISGNTINDEDREF